jgi:hypothetical protein
LAFTHVFDIRLSASHHTPCFVARVAVALGFFKAVEFITPH